MPQQSNSRPRRILTFEPVRIDSPGPLLACPQARIATNLSTIFGYAALNLAPLGPWVRLGWPSSVSTNTCIELASQYALESVVVFQHGHSEQSLARTSKIGLTALRSLQWNIERCRDDEEKQALVVAVMLHFAAEVRFVISRETPLLSNNVGLNQNFGGIATWRYVPHVQGICFLLKSYFADQPHNQLVQEVVKMICDHEVFLPLLLRSLTNSIDIRCRSQQPCTSASHPNSKPLPVRSIPSPVHQHSTSHPAWSTTSSSPSRASSARFERPSKIQTILGR